MEKKVKNKFELRLALHHEYQKIIDLGYLLVWDKGFEDYMWSECAIDMNKDLLI